MNINKRIKNPLKNSKYCMVIAFNKLNKINEKWNLIGKHFIIDRYILEHIPTYYLTKYLIMNKCYDITLVHVGNTQNYRVDNGKKYYELPKLTDLPLEESRNVKFYEFYIEFEDFLYNWYIDNGILQKGEAEILYSDGSKFELKEDLIHKNAIFLFEDISWFELRATLKYIKNFTLRGPSTNKAHMLSSLDERLSLFARALQFSIPDLFKNTNILNNSFHSYKNYYTNNILKIGDNVEFKWDVNKDLKFLEESNKILPEYGFLDQFNDKPVSVKWTLSQIFKDYFLKKKSENENVNKSENNSKTSNNSNNSLSLNNQKREYHTSTINYKNKIISPPYLKKQNTYNNNIISLNKCFHSSSINLKQKIEISENFSSYLKSIQTMINDKNLDVSEIQLKIEKNWMKIITELHEDSEYLEKRYKQGLKNKLFNAHRSLLNIVNSSRLKRKYPTIYPVLNKIELLMITFGISMTAINCNMGYNYITEIIGKKIIFYLFLNNLDILIKHNNLKISKEEITYQNFLETFNLNKMQIFSLGDFFLDILSHFPSEIFERKFNEKEGLLKNEPATLVINHEHFEEIKNNLIVEPSSLPMICKPKEWSDDNYGGYLTNNIVKDGIVTGSIYHGHQTKYKENLYKAINYMSSIKFRINLNLLNYLLNEGKYLLEELSDQSEELQRITTLQIAETYKNVPFYLPLQCDWRSRIYVKPFFINYQGGDLSLALVEYWDGEILNKKGIDNLYIYGANAYNQKNISKDTYNNRIKWVKLNMKNILKMEPEFMLKAENKYVFTSFCLTIREIEKDPNHLVNLPLFLDCTCSGIQHLAALMRDFQLASEVNLVPQDDNDVVSDIYNTLRIPINERIRNYGRENILYSSLANINLERKHVKPPIMTKTYNVTLTGITEQLISMFPKITKTINEKNMDFYLLPSTIDGEKIEVNFLELHKISEIINNIIFQTYPSLNLIYDYFINMTKLLNKLEIPVIWFTPSGIEIVQKYHISKQNKTGINFAGRTKKMVLREWTDKLNKNKQCTAIVPNIIHSLDSAHLINIVNRANENNINNVITVHDCFGSPSNSMHKLAHLVKIEFIKLYTDSNFLDKFHERNKQNILDNNFKLFKDEIIGEEYVLLRRTKHYLPAIPKLGDLELKNIIHSKHMLT
jgi:DNA-dependent RNA polymerase